MTRPEQEPYESAAIAVGRAGYYVDTGPGSGDDDGYGPQRRVAKIALKAVPDNWAKVEGRWVQVEQRWHHAADGPTHTCEIDCDPYYVEV